LKAKYALQNYFNAPLACNLTFFHYYYY